MLGSHFSSGQQGVLIAAFSLTLFAMWLQWRSKSGRALLALTCVAGMLRLFAALLDPFLNQWDECFHAVMAKNMIAHPFTPMLHAEEAMPVNDHWMTAHIWLHKPPFFLWQMAACIKLFGPVPWAVRLPSAIWSMLLVPVGHRMARILANDRAAWITAVCLAFSHYLQELTAGAIATDHNDGVFIPLVTCSLWALLELWHTGRWHWALVAGAFSGFAVLTKWYVGFSVFLPWCLVVVMHRAERKEVLHLLAGLAVTIIVVGPWLLNIALRFPDAAAHEWTFKSQHFSEAMDGHAGPWYFHFAAIDELLKPLTWTMLLVAYIGAIALCRSREHRVLLSSLFILVHVFFGLGRTKMLGYTMVLLPLYMIAVAMVLAWALEKVNAFQRSLLPLVSGTLALMFLDIERTHAKHTLNGYNGADDRWRAQQVGAISSLLELKEVIGDEGPTVVFHVPALHHIQFMFMTDAEAWDLMPDSATVQRLKRKGCRVFVLQDGASAEMIPAGVELISDERVRFPDVGRPE